MSGDHNMNCSANQALDKMAENARALGLDYEPAQQQEPMARSKAYDMIDRFLRNNLNSDDDYAEYSTALDSLYTSPQPAQPSKPLTDEQREGITAMWSRGHRNYTVGDIIDAVEAAHGIKGEA